MMDYEVKDKSGDRKYFTIIPNYILNHSPAEAQALYAQMKRVAGENGTCFMTQETYCEKLGVGIKKLRKALKYLLDNHWVDYIGFTPSKTRPVRTYRINDIWKQNVDFYDPEKIPTKRTISSKSKDTAQKSNKIPLKRATEEEPIKEEINQQEANASGIKSIGSILKKHNRQILEASAVPSKIGGAYHAWQDAAVRWWKKLGLGEKPTPSWFKIFKLNASLAERACSWASDSGGDDLEKLTYWALNQFKKHGKIVYDKPS